MSNSPLISGVSNGIDRIAGAIRNAAARTGVDFSYLYKQAEVESGLNAGAKARTSSATGLFQFLDQSWLSVLKQHGAKHGLGWAADCIGRGPGGRLCVTDPAAKQAVMDLRKNPEASALMAAEFASDNRAVIERATGRTATATDLYMGHFLGAGGAASFLRAMAANPDASAASVAPSAAASNRAVFYRADGSPRSLAEVYDRFSRKLGTKDVQPVMEAKAEPALPPTLFRALSGEEEPMSLARPRPETARLAYLVLAGLGA